MIKKMGEKSEYYNIVCFPDERCLLGCVEYDIEIAFREILKKLVAWATKRQAFPNFTDYREDV